MLFLQESGLQSAEPADGLRLDARDAQVRVEVTQVRLQLCELRVEVRELPVQSSVRVSIALCPKHHPLVLVDAQSYRALCCEGASEERIEDELRDMIPLS